LSIEGDSDAIKEANMLRVEMKGMKAEMDAVKEKLRQMSHELHNHKKREQDDFSELSILKEEIQDLVKIDDARSEISETTDAKELIRQMSYELKMYKNSNRDNGSNMFFSLLKRDTQQTVRSETKSESNGRQGDLSDNHSDIGRNAFLKNTDSKEYSLDLRKKRPSNRRRRHNKDRQSARRVISNSTESLTRAGSLGSIPSTVFAEPSKGGLVRNLSNSDLSDFESVGMNNKTFKASTHSMNARDLRASRRMIKSKAASNGAFNNAAVRLFGKQQGLKIDDNIEDDSSALSFSTQYSWFNEGRF